MRYSGIGGQAVMEGVMMKNQDTYAVAVRKPDKEIAVDISKYEGLIKNEKVRNIPIIRGVLSFIESLVLGMRTLTFSASFFEDEEEGKKPEDKKSEKSDDIMMVFTVILSVILAVAIFMVLPYYLSSLLERFITSQTVVILIEGLIRLAIFLAYISLISLMPDIKRVYMYHGAEHKCINCIEHGLDLNVENVRVSSRLHKRCGTSFLLFVMIVSIIFFMFIRCDNGLLRLLLRIVLIPAIAGVSYEFIRLAGRSDNAVVNLISKPGLLLQKLTTREPDDDMIEVGIASVEAVFDWRSYVAEINNSD
jgi:uncharacterized protein YqhQ